MSADNRHQHNGSEGVVSQSTRETRLTIANRQQPQPRLNAEQHDEYVTDAASLSDNYASERKKKKRRREAERQPPKPMWPAWLCLGLAALYAASPLDIIPDVPVIGIWDDILFAVLGIRKFERDSKASKGNRYAHRGRGDQPLAYDDFDDVRYSDRRSSEKSHRRPADDEPGFFGRVWKAITYLFMGGDTL